MVAVAGRTLQEPVLVLNRGYQAVAVTTVREALASLYAGKARAVNHADPASYETYDWDDWLALPPAPGDRLVRAPGLAVPAPQVIRLEEYGGVPGRAPACSRSNVYKRDRHTCQYCGIQPGPGNLTADHVLPRSQGGGFNWENIVASCYGCNQKKANRTPQQAGMRLRSRPVRPDWRPLLGCHAALSPAWRKFCS